jgi:hypothetical protein
MDEEWERSEHQSRNLNATHLADEAKWSWKYNGDSNEMRQPLRKVKERARATVWGPKLRDPSCTGHPSNDTRHNKISRTNVKPYKSIVGRSNVSSLVLSSGQSADAMQRPLAASSIECAQLLHHLSSLLHDKQSQARSSLEHAAIEDQYGRFSTWAGNLGAFQRLPATSSLDYRLRESPKIVTQIQELLDDLYEMLQSIYAIVSGQKLNRHYSADEDDEDDDESVHGLADEDQGPKREEEDQEFNYSDAEHRLVCSEEEELLESVKETITSLFRMSIIIRKASPRDRFAKALSARQAPFDESFDIRHVAQKYPKLDSENTQWLKERLGKAITQRRQYLRYAREQRNKRSKDVSQLWEPESEHKQTPTYLAAVVNPMSQGGQTNTTKPTSTLAPTAASTLILCDVQIPERDLIDNQSQTSYALSLGEEEEDLYLQLPRLVDVAQGSSTFECPLCWTIQNITSEKSWRKHGFSDLRPYLCTFEGCDLKLFSDRGGWFEHEMQYHRAEWHCHICERVDFRSLEKFQKHLRLHGENLSEDQLSALSEVSKSPVDSLPALDCPFCHDWEAKLRQANPYITQDKVVIVTASEFRQHVGSHMQQLALFAIPRGYLEDGAEEGSTISVMAAGVAKGTSNSTSPIGTLLSPRFHHKVDTTARTASEISRIDNFDVEECARVIRGAASTSTHALNREVIHIIPSLRSEELQKLRPHFEVLWDLQETRDPSFSSLVHITSLGQSGSDAYWLEHCDLLGVRWWEAALIILTRRTKAELQSIHLATPDCHEAHSAFVDYVSGCCHKTGAPNTIQEIFTSLLTVRQDTTVSSLGRDLDVMVGEILTFFERQDSIIDHSFLIAHILSKSDTTLRSLMTRDPIRLGPAQLFAKVHARFGAETVNRPCSCVLNVIQLMLIGDPSKTRYRWCFRCSRARCTKPQNDAANTGFNRRSHQ